MEPQLRRAYVFGIAVGLAISAAALIALVAGGILRWSAHDDEEERPPVVVSNGSVKFDAGSAMLPNKRGDFKPVSGATVYRHAGDDEASDKTVTSMDVMVEGTSSAACAAEVRGLTTLTIVTTKGSIVVERRVRDGGSKYDLAFTFPSNATRPRKARLRLLDHDLQGVEFAVNGATQTCTFDQDEDARQVTIQAR